jgi:hypothetical protein
VLHACDGRFDMNKFRKDKNTPTHAFAHGRHRKKLSSCCLRRRPDRRRAASLVGEEEVAELQGSFTAGRGTYRVDPPHGPRKIPYSSHNEYTHINITLHDGKKLAIIVTGSKSF